MQVKISYLMVILMIGISTNYAYSQEISLSTFQETAQVIIDKSISENVTASIILQSTSIQEIKIPTELEQGIREDGRIGAIVFTNEDQCILGVRDESCILINVVRNPESKGVLQIQNYTKSISELYIEQINEALDINAKFHSVFIHTADETNKALDTSGIISGRGSISAVYTLPMEDTYSMYEKTASILIPKIIRDGGGFYEVAKKISSEENAKMTFSIIPTDVKSLLQLKLSVNYPNKASAISEVDPLEFLKVKNIKRSDYFNAGFYPLNSIIQVVILSPENTKVSDVAGNIIPTQTIDDEKIPIDVKKDGWIFDPQEGQLIQGKYIFGEKTSVSGDDLKFSLGGKEPTRKPVLDESIIVLIIITIVAIAAAVFYLKGYKK